MTPEERVKVIDKGNGTVYFIDMRDAPPGRPPRRDRDEEEEFDEDERPRRGREREVKKRWCRKFIDCRGDINQQSIMTTKEDGFYRFSMGGAVKVADVTASTGAASMSGIPINPAGSYTLISYLNLTGLNSMDNLEVDVQLMAKTSVLFSFVTGVAWNSARADLWFVVEWLSAPE